MMFVHRSVRRKEPEMHSGTNWSVVVLTLIAACALAGEGRAWTTVGDGAAASPGVGALHRVAHSFASTRAALAAGYVEARPCTGNPIDGTHVHYSHPRLLVEPTIATERPQLLVYERRPGRGAQFRPGRGAQLRAVAYRVVHQAWHEAGNGLRPTLFGLPFELVERSGEERFYQLVVRVMVADARALSDDRPPLGDCARVRR
jgi:hypothetical protein